MLVRMVLIAGDGAVDDTCDGVQRWHDHSMWSMRSYDAGREPSRPLNMVLSLPLATVHRDSGCAFRAPGCADRPTDRARGRRRWTDRQTAPGRAGQTAPGGATGGEIRLRRGDRDPGGASASSRARGNFGSGAARPSTVDCRPQGLGGGEGGRLRRAGMRVRTWRHSARRNPQAFRLETRRHFSCRPRAGGRNPRLRSQSETSTLARVFSDSLGGGVAAPRPARAQNNFTGSTGHARPERTYTEHRTRAKTCTGEPGRAGT